MITNKLKKSFWKQNQILQEDCRRYHKTVIRLTERLQSFRDRCQAVFGIGLLSGLVAGLLIAELIRYLAGRC
jgi:hypothetical protein